MLDNITSFASGISEAQLLDRSIEVIPMGTMFSGEVVP